VRATAEHAAGRAGWLGGSAQGFAWLCQQLPALSNQQLSIARSEGSLWSGFTLHDIRWRARYQDVDIDRLQLQWQPADLWQGRLQVQLLDIGHVRVSSRPAPATPPAGAPASLSLPLDIRVEQPATGQPDPAAGRCPAVWLAGQLCLPASAASVTAGTTANPMGQHQRPAVHCRYHAICHPWPA
jgi:hypothetical protein